MSPSTPPPKHSYLHFCRQTMRCSGIDAALSKLSSRYHLNTSLLLYCVWMGESGRGRLKKSVMSQLLADIGPWHQHIVESLAQLRRLVHDPELPQWCQSLSSILKQECITAEQMEKKLLVPMYNVIPNTKRTPPQRLTDACENLATYCKAVNRFFDACACRAIQQILISAFPNFNPAGIEKLCFDALLMSSSDIPIGQLDLPIA